MPSLRKRSNRQDAASALQPEPVVAEADRSSLSVPDDPAPPSPLESSQGPSVADDVADLKAQLASLQNAERAAQARVEIAAQMAPAETMEAKPAQPAPPQPQMRWTPAELALNELYPAITNDPV